MGPIDNHAERTTDRNVTLVPDGVTITCHSDETILDSARRAGLRAPAACRRGGCGICAAWILEGSVIHVGGYASRNLEPSTDSESGRALCLPCRAVPRTNVTLEFKVGGRIPRTWASWLRFDQI